MNKRSHFTPFAFARSIRHLRERSGLTQPELAKALSGAYGREFTRSAVSMWECGRRTPKIYEVAAIADYFDVSVDALLGRKRDETEGDRFLLEALRA